MAKWKYTLLPNSRLLKFCLWYFIYDIKLLKFKYVSTFWPAFFLKKDYSWLAETVSASQELLQPASSYFNPWIKQSILKFLSLFSKIFQTKILKASLTPFGFRKSHGTQNSLVVMLEKWKRALDKGEYVSALFMDLSNAFDTINHDLLIAKLKACGFSKEAHKLMKSYLMNRKQKCRLIISLVQKEILSQGYHRAL